MRRLFNCLLCAVIITSMSACLGNDDDNNSYQVKPLTPNEKAAQMIDMSGDYAGYLHFTNDTTSYNDSISIAWRISPFDSILTIHNFPVKVFANGITEPKTRSLLLSGEEFELRAMLHPYANNFKTEGYYTFSMLPIDLTASFNILEDETLHSCKVTFTSQMIAYSSYGMESVYYSTGEYYQKQFAAYLLVKDVTVDNSSFTTGRTFLLYGKK